MCEQNREIITVLDFGLDLSYKSDIGRQRMMTTTDMESQEKPIPVWWNAFEESLQKLPQIADNVRNSRRPSQGWEIRCAVCKHWKCECSYSPSVLRKPFAICRKCMAAYGRAVALPKTSCRLAFTVKPCLLR